MLSLVVTLLIIALIAGVLGFGGIAVAAVGIAICALAPYSALSQAAKEEAPASPGATLYKNNCASCHDHPETTRALPRETMAQMPAATILFALTEGKMKAQGAALTETERNTLVGYLTGGHGPISNKDEWSQNMMCAADKRVVDLKGPATITTFGYDLSNTRVLTARQAGLTKGQLSNLELAWALAIARRLLPDPAHPPIAARRWCPSVPRTSNCRSVSSMMRCSSGAITSRRGSG